MAQDTGREAVKDRRKRTVEMKRLLKRLRQNRKSVPPSAPRLSDRDWQSEAVSNLVAGIEKVQAQDWPDWKKEIWLNSLYDQLGNITSQRNEKRQ